MMASNKPARHVACQNSGECGSGLRSVGILIDETESWKTSKYDRYGNHVCSGTGQSCCDLFSSLTVLA